MPRPAEIEVEECAAPNGSYSLSERRPLRLHPPLGEAAGLAQGADAVAPAGEDFMRIGLMPDIPDQPVARRVEHRMHRDGELHHAQRRPQMTAGDGDGIYGLQPQFIGQLLELLAGEVAHVGGNDDAIEKRCTGSHYANTCSKALPAVNLRSRRISLPF
jgi:hypothetical protein